MNAVTGEDAAYSESSQAKRLASCFHRARRPAERGGVVRSRAARLVWRLTCAYCGVVSKLAGPSQARIMVMSTVETIRCMAVECRKMCGDISFLVSAGTTLAAALT